MAAVPIRTRRQPIAVEPEPDSVSYDLDAPLLQLSASDSWTVRDACEGTQIFGAIGAGKTSGSGLAIASAFLKAGFGGLVLTAKPDEARLWERYCERAGRSQDLVLFSANGDHRFNFLDYEFRREGSGAGLTHNIAALFQTVLDFSDRQKGQNREPFWDQAVKRLLKNGIDVLLAAHGRITLPELDELVASAPRSPAEARDETWQKDSLCYQSIAKADRRIELSEDSEADGERPPVDQSDFRRAATYWLDIFPRIPDKTRESIVEMFASMADGFLRQPLRELFCTSTTITPEATHDGKIIVIDLPVKEYHELGQFAQVIWKYLWQRAAERRTVGEDTRPIFLWVDEAHAFLTSNDQEFQTTARSARACTVFLSQNISNYYAVLEEHRGRAQADSLLGNLATKIFHANGDSVTNKWAADLIARTWQFRANTNTNRGIATDFLHPYKGQRQTQSSSGATQSFDYQVLPVEFTTLRKGGPPDWKVDGIVFQSGRVWEASNTNHLRATFSQR